MKLEVSEAGLSRSGQTGRSERRGVWWHPVSPQINTGFDGIDGAAGVVFETPRRIWRLVGIDNAAGRGKKASGAGVRRQRQCLSVPQTSTAAVVWN